MRFFLMLLVSSVLASAAAAGDFYAPGPREIKGMVANDMLSGKVSIIINYGSMSMGDDAMQAMPVTGATPAVQAKLDELAQGEFNSVIVKGVVQNEAMTVKEIVDPSALPPRPVGWRALYDAQSNMVDALRDGVNTEAGKARLEACIATAVSMERDSEEPEAVRHAAAELRQMAQGLLLH